MDTGTFDLLYSEEDMDLAPTQAYSDGRSTAGVENMETDDDDDFWDDISVCDIEHSYFDMYPDPEDFGYDHQAQGNPAEVPDQDDDNSKAKKTTPNNTLTGRFQSFTEAELDSFKTMQANKETMRKTLSHVHLLQSFLQNKHLTTAVEEIPPAELNDLLTEFFPSVRKEKAAKDGSAEYEPSSLRNMLSSFNRYLRDKRYPECLITSATFHRAREMLKCKCIELKKQGKGNKSKKSASLSEEELEQLWINDGLGKSSPNSLVHTIWWNNMMHFGMRGVKEHHNLHWGDITEKTSSDGRHYLVHNERQTKMRGGAVPETKAVQSQMWELPENTDRCPVRLFKLYKSLCPKDMIADDKPVYLQPKQFTEANSQCGAKIWYKRERYGEKTLAKFMERICSDGRLSTDKKLTNTTARKTMIQRLMKANVPPTQIMQKSGHKRVESILNYGTIEEHEQDCMTKILTASSASSLNYNNIMNNNSVLHKTQNVQSTQNLFTSSVSGKLNIMCYFFVLNSRCTCT